MRCWSTFAGICCLVYIQSCRHAPDSFYEKTQGYDTVTWRSVLDTMHSKTMMPVDTLWCDSVFHIFNNPEIFKQYPEYVLEAFKHGFVAHGYSNTNNIDSFRALLNKYPVEKYKPWITYWKARSEVRLANQELNESATLHLLEAYNQFKKYQDTFGESLCCKWLGFLYLQSGQYEKSIEFSKQSLANATAAEEINILCDNIYRCYDYLMQYDSAECYADNYVSPYKHFYRTDTCKYSYYLRNEVAGTDRFFRENIPVFMQQESKAEGRYAVNTYCTILMHQKRFKEAEKYIQYGLAYTDSNDTEELYKIAYVIYDSLHNYPLAYKYLMLDRDLDSKYYTRTNSTNVESWLKKSDYQLKEQQLKFEKQITSQQLEAQRRQKYFLIGGCILLIVIAGLVFVNYKNQKKAKELADTLLLNILPAEVAEELKQKGSASAQHFDNVTVFFSDFKSFTTISEKLSPQQLVDELHECFSAFDKIISKHGIEKIKTVGDAYLAVSGLPQTNPSHATDVINAALEVNQFIAQRIKERGAKQDGLGEVRIGIHSGSVVAGIVGVKKFAYDIWGDTVNTAARMEQNSEAGKINISQTTYELVKDKFTCKYRGEIEAKNKGKLKMYFVDST